MSDEKKNRDHIKSKMLTFNLKDPLEKDMYEFSVKMKEEKIPFNRMLKNFILLYMINTGNAPEGYQYQSGGVPTLKAPPKKTQKSSKGSKAQLSWED